MKPPVFSIITVVYNSAELLRGTMASVFNQTYPGIEYLVIDGGSTDDTIEFLKTQNPSTESTVMFSWISEKDGGLYDAMNKGLDRATGDFVCFLNAGDWLFSTDTIERLAATATDDVDVIYGETMLVDESRQPRGTMSELSTRRLPRRLTVDSMRLGMAVVHQSFYVRKSIAPRYDLAWRRSSDIDWVINCLKRSRRTVNSGLILTNYLMGGLSKKQHRASLAERYSILRKHFGLLPSLAAHGFIVARAVAHRLARFGKPTY